MISWEPKISRSLTTISKSFSYRIFSCWACVIRNFCRAILTSQSLMASSASLRNILKLLDFLSGLLFVLCCFFIFAYEFREIHILMHQLSIFLFQFFFQLIHLIIKLIVPDVSSECTFLSKLKFPPKIPTTIWNKDFCPISQLHKVLINAKNK